MKKIFLTCLVALLAVGAYAQSIDRAAVQQATDELAALYQLDDEQKAKMFTIQERHFKNMAQVEPIKNTDQKLYVQKKRAVRMGTDASTKRLLTEAQMPIFNEQQLERRKKESEIIKQMKANGASKEEIQLAILEMEQ